MCNKKMVGNDTCLGASVAWVEIVSAPESELEEEGVQVVPVAVHPLEGVLRVCDDIYRCIHILLTSPITSILALHTLRNALSFTDLRIDAHSKPLCSRTSNFYTT